MTHLELGLQCFSYLALRGDCSNLQPQAAKDIFFTYAPNLLELLILVKKKDCHYTPHGSIIYLFRINLN